MHALVVEAVVRRPEELLERRASIERGVVFAGHEANLPGFEAADQLAELRETPAPLVRIVGGVREIAGEDDEVRLWLERVYRGDGLRQRAGGVGIRRGHGTPKGIPTIYEKKNLPPRGRT